MIVFDRSAIHFFYYLCMTLMSLMFYVSFGMGLMYVSASQVWTMEYVWGVSTVVHGLRSHVWNEGFGL